MAEVVERLIGHPACESAVSDYRHDATFAGRRLALFLKRKSGGDPVRVAERCRSVGVLHPVMGGLRPRRVSREATFLLESGEALLAACHDLVDIGLMPGVEQEHVLGGLEHPVQGKRELDDTQVRAQVPTGTRHGLHDEVAYLRGELLALRK